MFSLAVHSSILQLMSHENWTLCATSVFSVSPWFTITRKKTTTEAQRTQRLHREELSKRLFVQSSSIDVVANLYQKEMVSIRHIRIPNRVARITGDFRPNFEHDSRCEITTAMFASEPIGRKRDLLIQGLFETELPARSIRRSDHVLGKLISSKSKSCSALERFTHLGIDVVACVIGMIAYRHKQVVANDESPAVLLTLIWLPLDRWHNRCRVGPRLNIAGKVQPNLHPAPGANHDARHERGELRHYSAIGGL